MGNKMNGNTYAWLGKYRFEVHEYHRVDWSGLSGVSGLYIFAARNSQFQVSEDLWTPLYVGKAEDFAKRLPKHERWREAETLYGANHVHLLKVPQETERDRLEKTLIWELSPRMNEKFVHG